MLTIRALEEISLNAWPALQTILVDGWVLRFAEGYTRRANSVQPLYPTTRPLPDTIAVCERLYRARRLPVIFKLTTETQLVDLDAVLAQRGYGREGDAIVQVLDLAAFNRLPQTEYVVIEPFASDAWVDEYFRLNSERGNYAPILKRMLGNLIHPAAFVRLSLNGHCAALGMGVLEDGVLGLLGVVVDAPLRGQGFGTELMLHLLAWGRARGATGAYLQVTRENTAARRLYTSLGFAEAYRYWYRAKP